jgi:hypothetical protein
MGCTGWQPCNSQVPRHSARRPGIAGVLHAAASRAGAGTPVVGPEDVARLPPTRRAIRAIRGTSTVLISQGGGAMREHRAMPQNSAQCFYVGERRWVAEMAQVCAAGAARLFRVTAEGPSDVIGSAV